MHSKSFSLWRTNEGVALRAAYDLIARKLLLPTDLKEPALTPNGKKSRLREAGWKAFGYYLIAMTDYCTNN